MKRPKPVTCCTNCGTPGYDIQLANAKCGAWRGRRDARERTLAPTRRMIGLSVWHAMQPVGLVMGVANNVRVRAGFSSVGKRSDDIAATGCFLVSLGYSPAMSAVKGAFPVGCSYPQDTESFLPLLPSFLPLSLPPSSLPALARSCRSLSQRVFFRSQCDSGGSAGGRSPHGVGPLPGCTALAHSTHSGPPDKEMRSALTGSASWRRSDAARSQLRRTAWTYRDDGVRSSPPSRCLAETKWQAQVLPPTLPRN